MKKLLLFVILVVTACILGSIYGIIHDQITYSISPEYYTKFKFIQFELGEISNTTQEVIIPNPRLGASIVGIFATWWMGFYIGLILGLIGLIIKNPKLYFMYTLKSYLITIIVALATGLVGLIYGKLSLLDKTLNWFIPNNLIDKNNFILVGSMHNFSYLGGLIGLVIGITFLILKNKKSKNFLSNASR